MNVTTAAPSIATKTTGLPATFAVVVVAPRGQLPECDRAIAGVLTRGVTTITCEVPTHRDEEILGDAFVFGIAIERIAAAVDRASRESNGAPVVLVGHADAAIPARVFADLYPEELSGVVLTQATQHLTAA